MKSQKNETERLYKRLLREKRRNAELKRRIDILESTNFARSGTTSLDSYLSYGRFLLTNGSYYAYLRQSLKSTPAYNLWDKISMYFRRLRMISVTFRVATDIFAFVQTSAALILLLSFMIVALPAFAIVFAIITTAALIEISRYNKIIDKMIGDQRILVLIPLSPSAFDENTFFRQSVADLADTGTALVVVVSPFSFSSKGLYTNRPYISAKLERRSLLLIRKNYFYSFRKNVLGKHPEKAIIVS